MRRLWKRNIAIVLAVCVSCTFAGCKGKKQDTSKATATPAATAEEASSEEKKDLPEVEAGGKGKNKSDVPLVVACTALEQNFNPFSAVTEDDRRAVDLTQLRLLTFDREGAVVEHAIDGEKRRFHGEEFAYQGPANIRVTYDKKKKQTTYTIRIRKDMTFSDGEPVSVDDVIFSMYAFADSSYQGSETFGELPIIGLKQYQNAAENTQKGNRGIAGIKRLGDYRVQITTQGYQRDALQSLNIPICPLHVYGDRNRYEEQEGRFGFERGDISSLIKKKNSPLGAGAYRFIKYESGIVYYEANEKYYLGCPQTAFIQLKEIGEKTETEILEALANGDFDVADMPGSNDAVDLITATNSSGKLTGRIYGGKLYDGESYTYIGMNADTVCVDGKPDSTRSKKLRQALAILFSCNRSGIVDVCERGAAVINYPASYISWSVPQAEDEEYEQAYVKDVDGSIIYNSNMELSERSDAACKTALDYLKQAGFRIKKGKVVAAPENTTKRYIIYVPSDRGGDAMLTLVENTKRLFKRIGLKLVVLDEVKQKQIDRILSTGKHQLWCQYADTSVNGELYAMYHSREQGDKQAGAQNYFHISDSDLDEYIEETLETTKQKKSISLYEQCYAKILDWAVEVPIYQERDLTVFSAARVNLATVAQDVSAYYDWTREIQLLEMK